jgi:hypothetical protein
VIIQAPVKSRSVISVEPELTHDQPGALVPCHDLRKVGLQGATRGLRANVGDLDIVFVARARSDVTYCPICPHPHPA